MKLSLRLSHPQELCTCLKKNITIKSPEKLGRSFLRSPSWPALGHATQTGICAGIEEKESRGNWGVLPLESGRGREHSIASSSERWK